MRTIFWIALLSAWLCTSFGLLIYTQSPVLLPLAVAWLALATVMSLVFRRWGVLVAGIGTAVHAGLWLWLERDTGNPAAVLAAITAFGGSVWLSRGVDSRVDGANRAVGAMVRRIEELTTHVRSTDALKLEYGLTLLAEEVERCRRYHRNLSLLRVGLADPEDWLRVHGLPQQVVLARNLVEVLREGLRTMDRIVQYDAAEFLVLLPETPLANATLVAHRLARSAQQRLTTDVRIGVSEFPTSAMSADELVDEANAALGFARSADLTVVGQE